MTSTGRLFYTFGTFRLDPVEKVLFQGDNPVPLTPKAIDTLVALVEHHGHLVAKEELLRTVWPDAFVEENNLAQHVSMLRRVLGEDVIETVPKRGYRFVGPVTAAIHPGEGVAAALPPRTAAASPVRRVAFWGLIAAVPVAFMLAARSRMSEPPSPEVPAAGVRLAILPFENLTGDPEQDFFCDGLTEEMIGKLGNLNPRRLSVIARGSVMRYKSRAEPLETIGRELNVGYIGRAASAATETAFAFPRSSPTSHDERFCASTTTIAMSTTFLRCRAKWRGRSRARSASSWRSALQRAPRRRRRPASTRTKRICAGVISGTSARRRASGKRSSIFKRRSNWTPRMPPRTPASRNPMLRSDTSGTSGPRRRGTGMREAVARALALDADLPEANAAQAVLLALHEWRPADAEAAFQRTLALNPGDAITHSWYAQTLIAQGRRDEALEESRRAIELDPTFFEARTCLGLAHAQRGDYEEAARALERDGSGGTPSALALGSLGYVYARAGRVKDAHAVISELTRRAAGEYVPPHALALVHAGLGDRRRTLEWLERACDERSPRLVFVNAEPIFDSLRDDPRFKLIVERVGLQ